MDQGVIKKMFIKGVKKAMSEIKIFSPLLRQGRN